MGEAIKKEKHLSSGCSLYVTQITQYKPEIGLGGPSYLYLTTTHKLTLMLHNLLHIQLENRVNAVPTGRMNIQTAHHSPRLIP